jgi:hypothetical protein
MTTNEQADKSAWLAEHVMGMTRIPHNRPWIAGDDAWWVKDGRFIARIKEWNPFADIRQAKMVLDEMHRRGFCSRSFGDSGGTLYRFYNREINVSAMADMPTLEAAICTAAGRACKWPFEEDEPCETSPCS